MVLVDLARLNNFPLPSDILGDLQDAFQYYDKEDKGQISMVYFRNILHNFGFHKMSKKEIDDELKKNEIDPNKRQFIEFEWV